MRFNGKAGASVLGIAVSIAVGLLVSLEGYSDTPYRDSAGVLTDCFGNTKQVSLKNIRTLDECTGLLDGEAQRIGEMIILDVPPQGIPAGTLSSVISWTYNVGDGAYRRSTLRQYLIKGKYKEMCLQMERWVYITNPSTKKKQKLKGLENRRDKEVDVCLASLEAD